MLFLMVFKAQKYLKFWTVFEKKFSIQLIHGSTYTRVYTVILGISYLIQPTKVTKTTMLWFRITKRLHQSYKQIVISLSQDNQKKSKTIEKSILIHCLFINILQIKFSTKFILNNTFLTLMFASLRSSIFVVQIFAILTNSLN